MKKSIVSLILTIVLPAIGSAQAESQKIDVNIDNITTVESHIQFARYQQVAGGINQWLHNSTPVDIDKQTTIAMNRDTLYSVAIVDLEEPLTLSIPENDGRYFTLQVTDEDHFSPMVITEAGKYTLTRENIGTRYASLAYRVFMDPNDPDDLAAAVALQQELAIEAGSSDPFVMPDYDMERYEALFALIQQLVNFAGKDSIGAMGKRGEVDSLKHVVATIAGYGLLPPENAMYQPVQMNLATDKHYKIEVPADVPVNAFWSISMYNAQGFFEENDLNAYSMNSVTSQRNDDDSVEIHLGGCDDGRVNCLPLAGEGFYYQWRMYEPREEFLHGEFTFNRAEEVTY